MARAGSCVITHRNPKIETNPKDKVGSLKVDLSVVPPASIIYEAQAMYYGAYLAPKVDGTFGYGPFNWRDQPITLSRYYSAAMRHGFDFWDGEDLASDSLVHHLGHWKAGIGIIIDALECGTLIDDRPKVKGPAAALFEHLRKKG